MDLLFQTNYQNRKSENKDRPNIAISWLKNRPGMLFEEAT